MTDDWQSGFALVCVGIAAGMLLRRGWSFLKTPRGGCGGACSGCQAPSASTNESSLVTLDINPPRADLLHQIAPTQTWTQGE